MPRAVSRSLFDLWSRVYDAPLVQWAVYRPEHDAVIRALVREPCRSVLDLGCGTGQLARRLRDALPAALVVGADFSPGMLAAASARVVDGVRADATTLPFRTAAFDVVVSTEAFHWFPDQPATLREIRRVLRPGGRLLLTLVTPLAPVGRLAEATSRIVGQPFRWPTAGALRRQVEAAGLRVERQRLLLRMPGALLFPPSLTVARRS